MSEINKLFNPQSIAIVGASQERGKVGYVIAKNVLELGYQGKVFLVNPKHDKLFDHHCYKSLAEITEKVDLAVIAVPAKIVVPVIKEASGRIKNFAIISAGFSEIGEEGKKREEELQKIAAEKKLNILGPNCLGFIIPKLKLNASFAGGLPEAGNISFVTQSGALAVAIMDVAGKNNLKFSNIISIGNKMELDESEILEYLAQDRDTKVIGMYLEGIKDGARFIEIAQKISKPIIILKAGKTEKSQQAISSHTGALAGSDEIINAVFEKIGIIRAENVDDFLGLLTLASNASAPKNEKVIVITNAGGLGVLTTDAFKDKKITLADISQRNQKNLKSFLPEESSVANPIDVLGDADEERYAKTLQIAAKENADTIICLLTPQDQTPVEKIAEKIIRFKQGSQKNIIAVFMGGDRVGKASLKFRRNNIPDYFLADQAINALDKYYRWSMAKKIKRTAQFTINAKRKAGVRAIINQAKSKKRKALFFSEAGAALKLYGINTPKIISVKKEKDLEQVREFPVVAKVDSDKVLHKSDKAGLILNIKNQKELQKAFFKMKKKFPGERVIIQPMLPIERELILGIKRDETFGPVIVYGLGGIYTEILKMVDFLIPPAGAKEIGEALDKSKISFLFKKTRGQSPYDKKEVSAVMAGLIRLAEEAENIKELDINPLLIYNDGKKGQAIDVKIII